MTVRQAGGQLITEPAQESEASEPAAERPRRERRRVAQFLQIRGIQLAIVVAFLAAWQWVPTIPNISDHFVVLDPFFISSPKLVAIEVWHLAIGQTVPSIWGPLARTVLTAIIGTGVAIIAGGLAGLALGNSKSLERIFSPFIVALNAVPRIALIPVIVLVAGGSAMADALTAAIVVFFLVFFNAFEGSRGVPFEMTESLRIFGAKSSGVMLRARFPFAVAWVFASLPNAISHGLVGVVTAELFSGGSGVGTLLVTSVDTSDASLTFGLVVYLAIVGLALILGAAAVRSRLLGWWDEQGGAGAGQ